MESLTLQYKFNHSGRLLYIVERCGDFTATKVRWIIRNYDIASLEQNLRAKGYLYAEEKAAFLGITALHLGKLRRKGKSDGWVKVDGPIYMYAP